MSRKREKPRKKRKYEKKTIPLEITIDKSERKMIRTKGDGIKCRLVSEKYANVVLDKKNVKCEITGMVENPANKDYTRRNIITKGAILKAKTPDGKEVKLRVTSRPGQDGVLNAKAI